MCVLCCSPSGKLVQIEYALQAVAAGAPSVGIKGNWRKRGEGQEGGGAVRVWRVTVKRKE